MNSGPEHLVRHLQERGYHPRSNEHGKFLCAVVLEDLLDSCPRIAEHARQGKLVYDINRKIIVGGSEWNIDLILGPPPGVVIVPPHTRIVQAPPATIRIAIEAKTVMTEHGKARRNRQRDLDSFHQFVHRYDSDTIAAALTVVNIATRFGGDVSGLEANGAILVDHDNIENAQTSLVTGQPAPQVGDPIHYDSFLRRICDRYNQRWS